MWQTQGKEAGSQSQGSVGQSKVLRLKVSKPWPTGQNWPALPSVSVNHALLEHSHTHSYLYRSTHGPGLLSGYSGRAKYVQQTPHSPQPETYIVDHILSDLSTVTCPPLHKRFADPWFKGCNRLREQTYGFRGKDGGKDS